MLRKPASLVKETEINFDGLNMGVHLQDLQVFCCKSSVSIHSAEASCRKVQNLTDFAHYMIYVSTSQRVSDRRLDVSTTINKNAIERERPSL